MQRHTTDGFVKVTPVVPRPKPHSVQGPTAKVHPMTDMVMEDPTDSDHNVSYLQLKEVVTTGAVEAAAPPSQSITRADTELSLGSSLEKSSNGQALSSRGSTTTYSKRDRSSSGESKSFCKSEARGNLSPKSAALLQRRNSSISKQLSRTRTRERTLEDRVDLIEQKLAKYMYKTLGLRKAFEFYDKDGNAGLDRNELEKILITCNAEFHAEEFEHLMGRYDADGNGTITLNEFTITVPISRPRFVEYLVEKDRQRGACLGLPVTVLFFIWFVVLLSLHDVTGSAYAVESGVMYDLTELSSSTYKTSFYDVDTVDKVWDWMSTVLVPIAFSQTVAGTGGERAAPVHEWGTISSFNHLLGAGVSIQQTRGGTDACAVVELDTPLNASCHPWSAPKLGEPDSDSWSSNASFGVDVCSVAAPGATCYNDTGISDYVAASASAFSVVSEENRAIQPYPVMDPVLPAFELLLDAAQPQEELVAQLDYLRGREWIDESTKHVQALFAIYNGEFGTYMAVNFMWEINRGGAVIPSIKLQDSVPADPYFNNNGWIWLVDVGWIIMVLSQGVSEFGEMREQKAKYWTDFWNLLDWLQIFLTLALMVVWYNICFNGLYPLSDLWINTYNSSDVYERQEATSKLLLVLNDARDYRTGVVLNIIIILIRFFKAFLVQPRLSIVTHTFIRSFVDVVHFMVILACLLFAFVFTGIFLLGHKVADFADVGDALMRLYQAMLAVPLLKWDELKVAAQAADGYAMAMIWYVLFLFIICLVFKSMLLAIIMTAYAEARNKAGRKARTMWAQLGDVIISARAGARGALQLHHLIQFLHAEENENYPATDIRSKESVNILGILETYGKPGNIKSGTPKQIEFRMSYARQYLLGLVAEYFDFIDLKDPSDLEKSQRESFQRIHELDSDFKDIDKRLDRLTAEMHTNFSTLFSMLADIKGIKSAPASKAQAPNSKGHNASSAVEDTDVIDV